MSERKNILVVDDSAMKRDLLEAFLDAEGFEVRLAEDGQEGIDASLEYKPDLIVLDLHLPDIKGTEVCRRIRTDPKTKAIPIVIYTAQDEKAGDKAWGFKAGADDFLSAPAGPTELVGRIRAILGDS